MKPAQRHLPLVLGLMSLIFFCVTAAHAAITVSPTSANFGSVVIGTSSTQPVTVSQKGGGNTSVKVSFTTTNVGSFSASTTKFKVSKKGGPVTVTVTFTAGTSPGSASAVMKVNGKKVLLTANVISPTPTPTPTPIGPTPTPTPNPPVGSDGAAAASSWVPIMGNLLFDPNHHTPTPTPTP